MTPPSPPQSAEEAYREAREAIQTIALKDRDYDSAIRLAAARAALDACIRAAFQEGFDLGLSACEAAIGLKKEYPRVPKWLPEVRDGK